MHLSAGAFLLLVVSRLHRAQYSKLFVASGTSSSSTAWVEVVRNGGFFLSNPDLFLLKS